MNPLALRLVLSLLACWSIAFLAPVYAQETDKRWSLSVGHYRYSDDSLGHDLDLHWDGDKTTAWLGAYRDHSISQVRAGFDTSFAVADKVTLQPSLQLATHRFVGASATLQIGDPWYGLIGWGRTNLAPYFDQNFELNDAVTIGAGWNGAAGRTVSLSIIADDRLHTSQKDWHLAGTWPLSPGAGLVFDLIRKTGRSDGGSVHAWGATAGLDFSRWFLRLTRDPDQSFSTIDATRLYAGVRF